MNDLPMHYCPYCFFKCINERKLRGHKYHFHPMQKYKCYVCYQQFLCYSSLTSHSSRKHKINLTNLPFTNIRDPLLNEDITINSTENQIMEAESLVVQPSYEKLLCDLKPLSFVPETTFNEILSDLCMIKDFNEIISPSVVTCSVKSKYESLLKNDFFYITPEKVFLSNSENHYIYVPIKKNLKQYLSSANMIEQLELSAIKNANSITNPPKI
ncbi:uncharacterized protein LOC136085719 isoform X3 [Hydra vulgaris]|uniref:Uncharacterized protein LOC136085719 isoform X3 n=1 Tax=Hydra vulgaris TaxID=6087 RepID=A0ABM4CMT7_HYDVU